ncbi:hypothetical protein SO694_0025606 [Aureococcus anophagefferens]|uniref:Glycosyl transferase family 1 domain-containing protein n=1 Tax=Aureococcus anophagefferens TaxID=44056 RepID=A0ABR1FIT3_AURAN
MAAQTCELLRGAIWARACRPHSSRSPSPARRRRPSSSTAPPPIVATLPLLIDDAREAVELAVREGDDVAALLGAVTPRLSADNVDQVTSALYLRAAKGGHTVARRWWAVAAPAMAPRPRRAAPASVADGAEAAAASRPGAGVVVATDGFALGEASRPRSARRWALRARWSAAMSRRARVGPSAILAAAVAAAPDRAIVAAPLRGAAVRGDVRRLRAARAATPRGRLPLGGRAGRLPVADAAPRRRRRVLRALGAPDAGYALEGGVAAWLDDLGASGDAAEVPGVDDNAKIDARAPSWTPRRRGATTSYVRTSSELEAKVASFAHVRYVVDGWVDDGTTRSSATPPPPSAALDLGAPPAAHDRDDGAAAFAAVDVGGDAARTWRPNGPGTLRASPAAPRPLPAPQLDPSPGARRPAAPVAGRASSSSRTPPLPGGARGPVQPTRRRRAGPRRRRWRLAGPRPVDVLFVGKLNGRRRNILRALRYDHGLRVLHGNADGPLFGEPLKAALQGAKVVLSLRFFDDDREWKMTRFLPAVAAGAVVVAEPGGAPAEQAAWAGAVHFAAGGVSGLARAIRAYLDDDAARDARAAAALDVLRSRPMAAKLRRPLAKLARGACPGWVPETVEGDPAPWQWDVVMD